MKKGRILISSLIATGILLSGCSSKTEEKKEKTTNSQNKTTNTTKTTDPYTVLFEKKDLNATNENSSMKATVTSIKISKLNIENLEANIKQYAKLEQGVDYLAIGIRVNIENKLDKEVSINSNISHLLIKDTKEQTEQNQYLGVWNDTTYLPHSEKENLVLFIVKKSNLENIKNLSLNIDAPFKNGDYTKYESLTIDINNIQ